LSIVFLVSSFSPSWAEESIHAMVKKIKPSVISDIIYDDEGKIQKQGSGFFVFIEEGFRVLLNKGYSFTMYKNLISPWSSWWNKEECRKCP